MPGTIRYLIAPGIHGSEPDHWQSLWQRSLGDQAARTAPTSWDEPEQADWIAAIEREATAETVVVAHSLGCLATAAWLRRAASDRLPLGVFLVAAPDRAAQTFPAAAHGFDRDLVPLPVPAVVIASTDDPYCSIGRAAAQAEAWDAPLIEIGALGHINAQSGIGGWNEGRRLLVAFTAGLGTKRFSMR